MCFGGFSMEETVVGGSGNDGGEKSATEKSSSALSSSPKSSSDPVMYKLVRVEGDGRFVPATDDEVMEVEELLEDVKNDFSTDLEQTKDIIPKEGTSAHDPKLESPEGVLGGHCKEVEAEKSSSCPEEGRSSDENHVNQPGSAGQCSKTPARRNKSGKLNAAVLGRLKPDFSKLRGEICLDNLSIGELHETFKATFGRETSVKDKQWLKRRIAMGLSNSCDASTTTFIFKDNKLIKKGKEGSSKSDGSELKEPVLATVNDKCGKSPIGNGDKPEGHQILSLKKLRSSNISESKNEDSFTEERVAKRLRKPTRRYIEELEVESRECGGRLVLSAKNSGHAQLSPRSLVRPFQNIQSDRKAVVTRLDSLGGSGVQIPYVCRIRRGRPRENCMTLMEFHPSRMSMAAKLVKEAVEVHASRRDDETDNGIKDSIAPITVPMPIRCNPVPEPENDQMWPVTIPVEQEQDVEKVLDSSGETCDNNVTIVPTTKGGMRRKHHRAWTIAEVMKLVEGVARYGAGRWSEIKRLAFASYSYRTSVDLKDKWRNLLRASFARSPADKGMNSRKNAATPIPASILLRVRELAEKQA
ncbi:SANT/Myb domain [Dillenia turbinata]|uniref:SANT/Myb domain n=1 Tax=Dillenia turbinata TaxID=194707 RepID=A0AAN8YVV0_9MAGN